MRIARLLSARWRTLTRLKSRAGRKCRGSEVVARDHHRAARLGARSRFDAAMMVQDRAQGIAGIGDEVVVDDGVDAAGFEQRAVLVVEVVADIGPDRTLGIVEGVEDAA